MRILWFANTPSKYDTIVNGGGWIASLENILDKNNDCQLGIFFEYHKKAEKETRGNVTYYPIYEHRSRFRERYIDSYTYKYRDEFLLKEGLRVIKDFEPDIIHVWGSEWCYGLLTEMIDTPIVIHMQGCWPVYKNVISELNSQRTLWDYLHETHKPQLWFSYLRKLHLSNERAVREEKILRINKYFMGRTRWDKALVSLYSPEANYYYCSEALRESFKSSAQTWQLKDSKKCTLITVANTDMIKGYDLIFKTAKVLKDHSSFDFEWKLIGNGNDSLWLSERKTGIRYQDVNIVPKGQMPGDSVMKELCNADIFIQSSYIDNSPNAVCEAQYVGLPIIATNVGGVPSLFDNEYDKDLLVPLHEPYYLAAKIIELFNDKKKMQELSDSNKKTARDRHDDKSIEKSLFNCYINVIQDYRK